ncbi:uncharacterized protein LOC122278436 [Carya illinoinensis]|uniref:uncharacterized protein LOC122278436 n=1 Tax=Carya illinoinensis TaxID=32201 RepID=UPI001C72488F|nr:uncharacterized protein LOC122278436 [Carya illinoinensis]
MEDMEEVWRRLKLNDEEDGPIEIQNSDSSLLNLKSERSLVGKVISMRRIGKEVIRSMMERIWKVGKPVEFQEIGSNCYVITFVTRKDKVRVLDGRPWLFDNHLFVLKEFEGKVQPNLFDFDHACLWVQMLNLPLNYMTKRMGEEIGKSIGKVVEVDVQEDGSAWGRCLRVKVECDLKKPIARGRTILVDGRRSWVPFQYEKLPRLCFNCGRIVHEKEGCKGSDENAGQYGVWLRARPIIRKVTTKGEEEKIKKKKEKEKDNSRQEYEEMEKGGESQQGREEDELVEQGVTDVNSMLKVQEVLFQPMVNVNEGDDSRPDACVNVKDEKSKVIENKMLQLTDEDVESKRSSRWKRRARARPESGKQTSSFSQLKRNFDAMDEDSEQFDGGKRIKKGDEVVCDENILRVVAAEQHHLEA